MFYPQIQFNGWIFKDVNFCIKTSEISYLRRSFHQLGEDSKLKIVKEENCVPQILGRRPELK